MKIEETDFHKERTTFRKRNLKVFYGIDKLNKIMTKPCVSVIFENEVGGNLEKKRKESLSKNACSLLEIPNKRRS